MQFVENLRNEKAELDKKIFNLQGFITDNPIWQTLTIGEQSLLDVQLIDMGRYANTLAARLAIYEKQEAA